MLLKDLINQALLPNKEVLINKPIIIKGIKGIITSITSQNEKNILWALYHIPISNEMHSEDKKYFTNKEKMISEISMSNSPNPHFSEMTIQNQKVVFSSSQLCSISNENYESCMLLQHFLDIGVDLSDFYDFNLSELYIASYEFSDSFPTIDLSNNINISLTFDESTKEVLVNHTLNIDFENSDSKKRLSFYDPISKKDRFFYINKLKHCDIWDETKKHFNSEKAKKLSPDILKKLKEANFNSLEETCPRNKNLLILEYETEDGIQLNFYTKEYLNAPPIYSNSLTVMLFKPEEETGPNGLTNRICSLDPVDKNFNESITIELFSFIAKEPKETINIK